MRKNLFDDGLRPELLQKVTFDGILEIPRIEKPEKIIEPKALIPFSKRKLDSSRFVHFYEHDKNYQDFSNYPERYLSDLIKFPGIISPDNSVLTEAPLLAQMTNIYISRRNAAFLQQNGIYVIPNVRFGDERTFTTQYLPEPVAFSGIAHNSIVAIGTYGCIKTYEQKAILHKGLIKMLETLQPQIVVVYGSMPKNIFCEISSNTKFLQFENWTLEKHNKN